MKPGITIFALLFSIAVSAKAPEQFSIKTSAPENRNLKFTVRVPAPGNRKYPRRIMVLFGGRNWTGDRTLKVYKMDELADKYNLILLSPWFKNDEYWYPEKWSGKALFEAVAQVCRQYKVDPKKKLLYYGYSAGGQCANLFYEWKPERVKAWGVHACGVWRLLKNTKTPAPGIVTCGEDDTARFEISKLYIRKLREAGTPIIWLGLPGGHGLSENTLKMARSFFISVLDNGKVIFIADDQVKRLIKANSRQAGKIEPAYRNTFFDKQTAELWNSLTTD